MSLTRLLLRILVGAAYGAAGLLLWQGVIVVFSPPDYLLPAPGQVGEALLRNSAYFLRHTAVTATEAGLGATLGFTLGVLAALAMRYGGWFGRGLRPVVIASQVFPKEALAPVFLALLGFGMASKVLIALLIAFFPVVIGVERGLRETPESADRVLRAFGATPMQRFWRCHLPYAAPHIFSALRVCATLSVVGAVVGEFVGASAGLGHVVRSASGDIAIDKVYAALLCLGVLGALFYGLAAAIESLLFRRLSTALRST